MKTIIQFILLIILFCLLCSKKDTFESFHKFKRTQEYKYLENSFHTPELEIQIHL